MTFSRDAQIVLDAMRAAGRFAHNDQLIRAALWHYARTRFPELDVPAGIFDAPSVAWLRAQAGGERA